MVADGKKFRELAGIRGLLDILEQKGDLTPEQLIAELNKDALRVTAVGDELDTDGNYVDSRAQDDDGTVVAVRIPGEAVIAQLPAEELESLTEPAAVVTPVGESRTYRLVTYGIGALLGAGILTVLGVL